MRKAMIFFMDGVGLGENDPQSNPFLSAHLPQLTALFGAGWFLQDSGQRSHARATLQPTDAQLGVSGRPQSATGQATILSGRNVPATVGEHYGPKPNQAVRDEIDKGTLFAEVHASGGSAALLTPYPHGYFKAIDSGRRLYSSVPYAAVQAGLGLYGVEELRTGRAISPGFTGEAWRDQLGYADIPTYSLSTAGAKIAAIAETHTFSFFEHWPSDRLGHRGTAEEAARHLELLDSVLGSLITHWADGDSLLIITSDHGNIEDKSSRRHTENPVPTIVVGEGHAQLADRITSLTDIAPVVRGWLGL